MIKGQSTIRDESMCIYVCKLVKDIGGLMCIRIHALGDVPGLPYDKGL